MKKIIVVAILLFASLSVSTVWSGSVPPIPQIQTVWRVGIIVGVLAPAKTTNDQLKALIYEFKKARMTSSLTKYIPATTPGIKDDPYQQVIIFVFSDPKWATEDEYKKYERSSMKTQSGKSTAKTYLNHIRASYEWDKFEGKEYGSLGCDEGGMRSASYKKLF